MRQMICGLALFGIGIGSLWSPAPALAVEPAIHSLDDVELLRSYWHCDRQAGLAAKAGERFDDALMQLCGGVLHELQSRRFGGDFGALHHWTETSRAAAHASMDDGRPRLPGRLAARTD